MPPCLVPLLMLNELERVLCQRIYVNRKVQDSIKPPTTINKANNCPIQSEADGNT